MVESVSRRIQRPSAGERANVKFIDYSARQRWRLKSRIAPCKGSLIVQTRHSMHAIGLPPGPRVRNAQWLIVDEISIIHPRASFIDVKAPPTLLVGSLHRLHRAIHLHCHFLWQRRPDLKSMHGYSTSRVNSATGKWCRIIWTRSRPPMTTSCVRMFFHRPGASSTVVEAQLPFSFSDHRGTKTAT